ncbi:hypothetical protein K490DRAFT_41763 [Saccharata proteae CBS 121410]|uniref:HMG box domain-containing protein n=1 Tax=Saccharata proteae CBS 121410 TaxID=1314787 RepID=A0A9P4HY29_9PEZI|nr:hypothetical protein K490DRAFT_41763 [Saccharata proteae CBS 121410]
MSQDLVQILERLRLSEYLLTLTSNGFDTWPSLCVITEDDLAQLGFKLGHRRILQREISSAKVRHLSNASSSGRPKMSPPEPGSYAGSSTFTPRKDGKRRYRRHPRPDPDAPKKPKTAYVNFADHLRTDPDICALSFVEIAKEVGRQWQCLAPEKKHEWERAAARDAQEYEAQMDQYKTTDSYRRYRDYLARFWHDHGSTKRVKPEGASASDNDTGSDSKVAYWMLRNSDDTSSPGRNSKSGSSSETQESDVALAVALRRLASVKDEQGRPGVPAYDITALPPEKHTKQAVRAFMLGTGSLFYILAPEHAEQILDQVYNSELPDVITVITVLIMAALGAYYDIECMSEVEREGLFKSADRLLRADLLRAEQHETMRLMLLFSLYSVLEKHTKARDFVAAGLSIARWRYSNWEYGLSTESGRDDFRKVFRTLIFMDCWLSTSLGYPSIVTSDDIIISQMPAETPPSENDDIYEQAIKIGLISRDIAETLRTSTVPIAHPLVEKLIQIVDDWYKDLPPMMQLSGLNDSERSSQLSFFQKRAVLMVHVLYLGVVISLYRGLVVMGAERPLQTTNINAGVNDLDAQDYRVRLTVAAHQMARILNLITFDGIMTKRCWLMIYWSFNACAVLLFSVTQSFLGKGWSDVDVDMAFARGCLDVLMPASSVEVVALRCIEVLQPLYDAIQDFRAANWPATTLDPHTLMANSSIGLPTVQARANGFIPTSTKQMQHSRILEVAEKLTKIMSDPFHLGRESIKQEGARDIPGSDGCSVFWWQT